MMAPRYVLLLLSVVFPATVSTAADDPAMATVTLKKGDSIIFFGDSLTALAEQDVSKKHFTKGYVRTVREKLQEAHSDLNIKVESVATGGHTVPDLLKR